LRSILNPQTTIKMETADAKATAAAPSLADTTPAQHFAATHPPSPPLSASAPKAEVKVPTSADASEGTTPPFSPTSQTQVLQKEQEEFEGNLDVNDDLPTEKDLQRVGDLLLLDDKGQSRPFKELYNAPHVAPRQLIIFIRHFFCGVSCATASEVHQLTGARIARNICAPCRPL
jgi:hypothetical protein